MTPNDLATGGNPKQQQPSSAPQPAGLLRHSPQTDDTQVSRSRLQAHLALFSGMGYLLLLMLAAVVPFPNCSVQQQRQQQKTETPIPRSTNCLLAMQTRLSRFLFLLSPGDQTPPEV